MSTQTTQNYEEAYMCLVKGVKELDIRGSRVPSELVLIGDKAFPLVINSQGQVLMAASQFGRGRIVVLGHDGYMSMFPTLLKNALTWLRGDGSDNKSVAVHKNVEAVANNLSKASFQVEVVEGYSSTLASGVYVTDAYSVEAVAKDLVAFVKNGGGLLIGGQAWYWFQDHSKENTLLQFQGNKVSAVAGIYFTERKGKTEILSVCSQVPSPWMTLGAVKDFDEDMKFLLQDVSALDLRGGELSSDVLVHGPLAFPYGVTEDGRPFLAAAYYGLGRVVMITHEGYFKREALRQLWTNALRWLDQGRQGTVGISAQFAFENLSRTGFNCQSSTFRDDLSVYVCVAYSDAHANEIQEFVAQGGGLLIGGHAWYWSQTHSDQEEMTDFPGNKILNKMGLSVLDTTMGGAVHNVHRSMEAIKNIYLFRHLLHRFASHTMNGDALTEQELGCLKRFGRDCGKYLHLKAHDWPSYSMVLSVLTDVLKKKGMPQVSEEHLVTSPEDHLFLNLGSEVYRVCPDPDDLQFYLIKDIPNLPFVKDQKIKINVKTESTEWISTGLYLSPGMKTDITVPAQMVNKGWKIQIGCQTDYLSNEVLKRAPRVYERYPITTESTTVWNLWGGLIYLLAPPRTQVEGAEVNVQMAVLAPYYKFGVTTAAEWSELRKAPSSWAELEGDNIILTVPSDFVRNLETPETLMELWHNIMKAVAELAAIPNKLPRKERIVTEVQISHGWMHSGYPIMGHVPTASYVTDFDKMKKSGLWGPIHELGHNQQRGCWEFPSHTTECTCNLWSVYVHEEVLGIDRSKAHSNLTQEKRKHRTEDYVKGGRKLSDWTVWTALETYLQLQEKFGWDAIKKVFGEYHGMNNFPRNNEGKMNLYAETFSRAVGMNLTEFFKAWGWPIERATEDNLSFLPAWGDHPMTQYN